MSIKILLSYSKKTLLIRRVIFMIIIVTFKVSKDLSTVFNGSQIACGNNARLLSNSLQNIEDFKEKNGNFYNDIKNLLSTTLTFDVSQNDFIFYVPSDMSNQFIDLFKNLFADRYKDKQLEFTEDTASKPVKDNNLSSGRLKEVQHEIIDSEQTTILKGEVTVAAKDELKEVFNAMAKKDNEIDAVLLCSYAAGRLGIVCNSDDKKDSRSVDIPSFKVIIKLLADSLQATTKSNERMGLSDYTLMQYRGGIIHVTHFLPEKYGEYQLFLVFVSATPEGIAWLELERDRNLPEITKLVAQLGLEK